MELNELKDKYLKMIKFLSSKKDLTLLNKLEIVKLYKDFELDTDIDLITFGDFLKNEIRIIDDFCEYSNDFIKYEEFREDMLFFESINHLNNPFANNFDDGDVVDIW